MNKDGLNSSKYQKLNDNLKTNQSFDEYLNYDDEEEEEDEDEFSMPLDEDSIALDTSFKYNLHSDDIKLNKVSIRNNNDIKNDKMIYNEKSTVNSNIEKSSAGFNQDCELKNDKKFILSEKNLIREEKVFSHIDNINDHLSISNTNNNSKTNKKLKSKNNKKNSNNKNETNKKLIKRSNNKKQIKNKKSKLNGEYNINANNMSNQIFHSSSENYSPTSSISTSNTSFNSYDYHQTQQINYNQQHLQQRQQHNYPTSCSIYSPAGTSNNVYTTVPEFFELIQPNRFHDYHQLATSTTSNNLMASSYHYYNQPNLANKIFQNSKLNQDYNNYQSSLNYKSSSSLPLNTVSPLSIDPLIKVPSLIIGNKSNQDVSNVYSQKQAIKDLELKSPIQSYNNLNNDTSYKSISFNNLNNIDHLRTYSEFSSKTSSSSNICAASLNKINNINTGNLQSLENSSEHKKDPDNLNTESKNFDKQKFDKIINKNSKSNSLDYTILNPKFDARNNNKNTSKSKLNNLAINSSYEISSNTIEDSNSQYNHYQQQLNYNLTSLYKTSLTNQNYSPSPSINESLPLQPNTISQGLYNYVSNKTEANQQIDENEIYNQNSQSNSNRLHSSNFNESKNLGYYNNSNIELTTGTSNNNINRLSNPNEELNIPVCYDYHSSNRQNVISSSQGFVMIN